MQKDNKLAEVEQFIRGVWNRYDPLTSKAQLEYLVTGVLPVISRLLDMAHADALRAAANHFPFGNQSWVSHCECGWKPNGAWPHGYRQWQAHILHLTPERARLERELEMARASAAEAELHHANAVDSSHRCDSHIPELYCCRRLRLTKMTIANLEAKLAALEEK